ncbi:type II toxin-antitoxin system RelE/ParE family toxin [Sphingobium rhizovicinum]|uniref:Type II toxin-antitoxin system RelE/ParE family toxin n=1 Tax=Sphingobium rhizovicinum TaxID=432308 RepID=A0ABV7NAT5_9SPHN
MPRIRLSVAARQDLDDIQDRGLEAFGLAAVRRHMQGFNRIFALLRTHPAIGEARPDYGDSIRVFSHRPHRIFYHVGEREILIVRVLHAAMDAAAAMRHRP